MCNLSDRIFEKGYRQGFEIGFKQSFKIGFKQGFEIGMRLPTLKNLRSLMKTTGITAVQAMWALEIPAEEQPIYLPLLTDSFYDSAYDELTFTD